MGSTSEHPSLPRFGLDEAGENDVGDISNWDDLSWGHMEIDPASGWIDAETIKTTYENVEGPSNWETDAAGKAWITWQKPVRVVMHAESLLGEN